MSQEDYLGWVEITSNVPGADIFIDDKSIGAVGKTPLSQNIKPGKHTFWISAEGYDEYKRGRSRSSPGETHAVKATLKGSPVGKLNVIGLGIEDSRRSSSTARCCASAVRASRACPQGEHTVDGDARPATSRTRGAIDDPGEDRDDDQGRRSRRRRAAATRSSRTCSPPASAAAASTSACRRTSSTTSSRRRSTPACRRPTPTIRGSCKGKIFAIAADAHVRDRRHHGADRDLLHVPRQGRAVDGLDRRPRARAAAAGRPGLRRPRHGGELVMRTSILLAARRSPLAGCKWTEFDDLADETLGRLDGEARTSARRTTASRSSARRRRQRDGGTARRDRHAGADATRRSTYDAERRRRRSGRTAQKLGAHFDRVARPSSRSCSPIGDRQGRARRRGDRRRQHRGRGRRRRR